MEPKIPPTSAAVQSKPHTSRLALRCLTGLLVPLVTLQGFAQMAGPYYGAYAGPWYARPQAYPPPPPVYPPYGRVQPQAYGQQAYYPQQQPYYPQPQQQQPYYPQQSPQGYPQQSSNPYGQTGQDAGSTQPLGSSQLDQLVAPIALYPDGLVAQVLTAATYPAQVAEADRWLQAQGNAPAEQIAGGANAQNWDPSVKALTAFPQVLEQLDHNLDWTTDLGNAYFNQPSDVLEAVQQMRQRAENAGNLQSNAQQTVAADQGAIAIAPANPQVVYVPAYNPWVVYGPGVSPYPGYSILGALATFAGAAVQFGLGVGIAPFSQLPFGFLGWGLNWLAHAVLFHNSFYVSRSNSVADWGFAHGGRRAFGNGFAHEPARGYAQGRSGFGYGNRFASQGYGGRPAQQAYNHMPPAFTARGANSFSGGYRGPASGFAQNNFAQRSTGAYGGRGFGGFSGRAPSSGGFHPFGGGAPKGFSSHASKGFGGGGGGGHSHGGHSGGGGHFFGKHH